MADIARRFSDRVVIWGGVPSTLLEEHVSDTVFDDHMAMLRDTISPRRLIVGLADQAMPTSRYDRLEKLAAFFAAGA